MEWNWLTIAVAGVFLLGFLIGIYRGAIRIAVSPVSYTHLFLRSHENFPNSICAHPSPERPWNRVLAAVVQDLTCGEMHVAFGNPCETDYKKYRFRKYPINNK